MNDQDRGAYTPGGERPLAFDARGPSGGGMGGGGRAPVPLALVGSAGVLVVVVVGLVLAYRGGGHGGGAPHEVGQPVGAMKVAAAPGAQPAESSAGSDVYAAQNVPASKPSFAPPPEVPAPRPVPQMAAKGLTVRTVDTAKVVMEPADDGRTPPSAIVSAKAPAAVKVEASSPKAVTKTVAAAPAVTKPAKVAPPVPVAAKTVRLANADEAPLAETTVIRPAKPAPAVVAAVAVKTPKPVVLATAKTAVTHTVEASSAGGGAAVQIGAFSSRALADKGFSDVSGLMSGRMSGHGKAVEAVDREGKTLFRTTVTGFADKETAKAFCIELQGRGHTCIVKG